MIENIVKTYKRYRTFLWFVCSGTLAFIVDFIIYWLIIQQGLPVWLSRAISFICAATFTWGFNSAISFRGRNARLKSFKGWGTYLGLALIGGALNYTVSVIILNHFFPASPLIILMALAAGSLSGLIINFITNHYWFFKR